VFGRHGALTRATMSSRTAESRRSRVGPAGLPQDVGAYRYSAKVIGTREAQRAELHKTIWRIANDLRGSVDGWDFKSYVLGILFYRFISENGSAPGGLPRVRLPCIASRSRKSPKDNAAVTAAREILRMIAASSRRRPW
jgi:hypothetical protein